MAQVKGTIRAPRGAPFDLAMRRESKTIYLVWCYDVPGINQGGSCRGTILNWGKQIIEKEQVRGRAPRLLGPSEVVHK